MAKLIDGKSIAEKIKALQSKSRKARKESYDSLTAAAYLSGSLQPVLLLEDHDLPDHNNDKQKNEYREGRTVFRPGNASHIYAEKACEETQRQKDRGYE